MQRRTGTLVADRGSELTTRASADWRNRQWRMNLRYTTIGEGFNDELGFIPRTGVNEWNSQINRTLRPKWLPKTIREMVVGSIDVIIQAARLRDGSRRITHITEVMGMEGDTIITQDIFLYDMIGEDANGKIIGRHRSTGIGRPKFWERARYYNEEKRLAAALDAAEVVEKT